jgi:hypothetical protein
MSAIFNDGHDDFGFRGPARNITKCLLGDGSVRIYDACTVKTTDPDMYKGVFEYIGTGSIYSINGVKQNSDKPYRFYTRITKEINDMKTEFKVGDRVDRFENLNKTCGAHYAGEPFNIKGVDRFSGDDYYIDPEYHSHNGQHLKLNTTLTNHQAYIDAMEATIRKYGEAIMSGEEYSFEVDNCGLCQVTKATHTWLKGRCEKVCPCYMVGKKHCAVIKPENYPARIIELREWKAIYQEDLDKIEKVWEPVVGDRIVKGGGYSTGTGVVVAVRPAADLTGCNYIYSYQGLVFFDLKEERLVWAYINDCKPEV